jgi:hypothetical protein
MSIGLFIFSYLLLVFFSRLARGKDQRVITQICKIILLRPPTAWAQKETALYPRRAKDIEQDMLDEELKHNRIATMTADDTPKLQIEYEKPNGYTGQEQHPLVQTA